MRCLLIVSFAVIAVTGPVVAQSFTPTASDTSGVLDAISDHNSTAPPWSQPWFSNRTDTAWTTRVARAFGKTVSSSADTAVPRCHSLIPTAAPIGSRVGADLLFVRADSAHLRLSMRCNVGIEGIGSSIITYILERTGTRWRVVTARAVAS